jgi:hypothetical protein
VRHVASTSEVRVMNEFEEQAQIHWKQQKSEDSLQVCCCVDFDIAYILLHVYYSYCIDGSIVCSRIDTKLLFKCNLRSCLLLIIIDELDW